MASLRLLFDLIVGHFADEVYTNRSRARELWLVAPWLSLDEAGEDPIGIIVEGLSKTRCHTYIVTRPPKENWHALAIDVLRKNLSTTVLHCTTLHAKVYLLECDGFRYALLGSPNLTGPGNRKNREVAVEFRTTSSLREDDVGRAIEGLSVFVKQLSLERDVMISDD